MRRCLAWIAGAAVLVLLVGSPAGAANVHAHLQQPASLFTHATVEACTNHRGPFITLYGELSLGGIQSQLLFRNNVKGTHQREEPVTASVVLLPMGETIRFNKQPVLGGVGGNPWIYVQFLDGSMVPISEEILLGRCVQGLNPTSLEFLLPTDANVDVTGGDCSNSGGPFITLSGELTLGGINARIIFRNNQKGTHEHDEFTEVSVVILPAGESITFSKSPSRGGVGGNPLIWFQFLDGTGFPYGGEAFLGRCSKLNK